MMASTWDTFCDGSTFWNDSLTWDGTWPEFSYCFENTVVPWVPCVLLWVTSPCYVYYLKTSKWNKLSFSFLMLCKTLLVALMCTLSAIQMVTVAVNNGFVAGFWAPFVRLFTMLLSLYLMALERRAGFVTSGVLFVFWMVMIFADLIPFYSKIFHEEYKTDRFGFALFYVYFFCLLCQLVVHCFAERVIHFGAGQAPCPEGYSSFLSRVTFSWMNKLMFSGYKRPLVAADVWPMHLEDRTDAIAVALDSHMGGPKFNAEPSSVSRLDNNRLQHIYTNVSFKQESDHGESTPLLGAGRETTLPQKSSQKSFIIAMLKTFGPEFVAAQIWKVLYDVMLFLNPTLLKLLIDFTEDLSMQEWKGYLYSALFLLVAVFQSFLFSQIFYRNSLIGMRMKTAIMSCVYKKALTISTVARKEATVGEIVNLMSVDAQHVQDVMIYMWSVWAGPVEVVLCIYFLYTNLGVAAFAGLAALLLLIPSNVIVTRIMKTLQEKQMELKDSRMKLMNEILSGIKILKLYAWEDSFEKRVTAIRTQELRVLRYLGIVTAITSCSWNMAPFIIGLTTFGTYIYISEDHLLSAEIAFVALSLFNILRVAIIVIPFAITESVKTFVSLKRISWFLRQEDLDESLVTHDPMAENAVTIENGSFSWDENMSPCLNDVNLVVPDGKLVAVVGQVGAGKSSLLSAILGETEKLKGNVVVKGSVAYVPQEAWIQNATLRDNILFGKKKNTPTYDMVVDACALTDDLQILIGGDLTEIGEKGINLSGGQKQRVSLARAVYNDADVYLLDDPLSAVDSNVGKHIFEQVIGSNGILKNKTRILVTHGIQWLPLVDLIVVISNGKISEMGSYEELLLHEGAFAMFLQQYLNNPDDDAREDSGTEDDDMRALIREHLTMLTSGEFKAGDDNEDAAKQFLSNSVKEIRLARTISRQRSTIGTKEQSIRVETIPGAKLIEEETSESGRVKWAVVTSLTRAIGSKVSLWIMACLVANQAAIIYGSIWLSAWTEDPSLNNATTPDPEHKATNNFYFGIYGVIGLAQFLFSIVYAFTLFIRLVRACRRLHKRCLTNVMRSPMSFFDTTPLGRIVNRFSQDIDIIDSKLPGLIDFWLTDTFSVLVEVVIIMYSTPEFLVVILPLSVIYVLIQRFYIPTSRQLKRMESTARSPIYNHFSETLTGASVIRAYRQQSRFISESQARIDKNQSYYFASVAANRWLSIRLGFLGYVTVFFASLFAVLGRDSLTGGIVGLSVSYALQVTGSLDWSMRLASEVETNMVSVERITEYSETPQEAAWILDSHRPDPTWPASGLIEFRNYATRYRKDLNLVINNITVTVQEGQRVGIVGRTGAGKSSLTLALFRLIEAADGAIIIDGEDVSKMGLHDLRSKITILPQDPVIFSGTIRMNMDPEGKSSDEDVWKALEHAHLKSFIQSVPGCLDYECGEGGENLSLGQRQLVCLARTLLRKTKVLVLDEATAAVDMETDDLIQNTIRTEFAGSTIISIAHRLHTIMDYDKILVMDQGNVREYDTPHALLQNTAGAFYKMARDAGLV